MNTIGNKERVLIVDDEEDVRFILQRALRNEGYILETAVNGVDAINKIKQTDYDLVLLDLYMEPIGGMQVFEAIREKSEETVVIILTAHGSLDSSVAALRYGAFDYLFKPATPIIVRERVREGLAKQLKTRKNKQVFNQISQLRQLLNQVDEEPLPPSSPEDAPRFLQTGSLSIDLHYQIAFLNNKELELTTTEYNLLRCLVDHAPEPISARDLVLKAMEYEVEDREAREMVKFHIHKLRHKIESDASRPQYIVTVRYKGYMWRG